MPPGIVLWGAVLGTMTIGWIKLHYAQLNRVYVLHAFSFLLGVSFINLILERIVNDLMCIHSIPMLT